MNLIRIAAVILAFSAQAKAENLRPYFEEEYKKFPTVPSVTGVKGKLQWQADKKARRYKTRLIAEGEDARSPNFAGHYFAVNSIGCGSGCSVIFIIDWESGKIFYPPDNIDAFYEFKKDSRLIILNPYDDCSSYGSSIFYEFSGEKFHKVKNDHPCP